jgi:hypothetical protein
MKIELDNGIQWENATFVGHTTNSIIYHQFIATLMTEIRFKPSRNVRWPPPEIRQSQMSGSSSLRKVELKCPTVLRMDETEVRGKHEIWGLWWTLGFTQCGNAQKMIVLVVASSLRWL